MQMIKHILLSLSFLVLFRSLSSELTTIESKTVIVSVDVICDNIEQFQKSIDKCTELNIVPLVIITDNLADDPYTPIYLGWISHLFKSSNLNIDTLIFDCKNNIKCGHEFAQSILENTPSRSVIANFQHSNRWDLESLILLRKSLGYETVLFHLNHEQPWQNFQSDQDGNMEKILEHYKSFKLVIRNYYYKLYDKHAFYLPLGVPLYGLHITPFDSIIKSSKRLFFCTLACRFEYSTNSTFHVERQDILQLIQSKRFPCAVRTENSGEFRPDNTRVYSDVMKNTVFVPCPSGNNPETFRHYEALESGAIPVFVHKPSTTADDDRHFLTEWNVNGDDDGDVVSMGYPGPVLSSWEDFEPYVTSMDPIATDRLQQSIQTWYSQYKQKVIFDLEYKLKEATARLKHDDVMLTSKESRSFGKL
eukprot:gene4041-8045_t